MKSLPTLVILLACAAVLCACCSREHDPRLTAIDGLASVSPREAMRRLDSIDRASLSGRDRHYFDLLYVKTRDKAYVTHTSDSLILPVIDYWSSYESDPLYPEALYYGGRVCSDLGDYPAALNYFQSSLEAIEETGGNAVLKGAVLSQTGRLLSGLHMHSRAIPYIKEAVELDSLAAHTFNLAYDHKLLSTLYENSGNLVSVGYHACKAARFSSALSDVDRADLLVPVASVLQEEGKTDSALRIIRPLPALVDSLMINYTLAVAALIYESAGIPDTAYMYARRLVDMDNPDNKKIGYKVIFSPVLREYVPKDTLLALIPDYKEVVEEYLRSSDAQATIVQDSFYNYRIHLREREKAESRSHFMYIALLCVLALSAVLVASLLYLRMRHVRQILRLRNAYDVIAGLRMDSGRELPAFMSISGLKDRILEELSSLGREESVPEVSPVLLESEAYAELSALVRRDAVIPADYWSVVDETVGKDAPEFRKKLESLTDGKLTDGDYEIALLTRFGFHPSEIAILLGRSRSTVSTRRATLGRKIFGPEFKQKMLDRLIRSL